MAYWLTFKYLLNFNGLRNYFQIKSKPPPHHEIWDYCESLNKPDAITTLTVNQVHSNKVINISSKENLGKIVNSPNQIKADGLITPIKRIYLRIKIADCIPLYLYSTDKKVIGLIHVGRRGVRLGIVNGAIRIMLNQYGCKPSNIFCMLGPGISKLNYTVQSSVANNFPSAFVSEGKPGWFNLDLKGFIKFQLTKLQIPDTNIFITPFCTFQEKFMESYRRDKDNAGRMQALIGMF